MFVGFPKNHPKDFNKLSFILVTGVCIIPFMSRMSDNIFGDDWYVSTEAQAARQTRPSAVAFHMRQTFPPMLAGAD